MSHSCPHLLPLLPTAGRCLAAHRHSRPHAPASLQAWCASCKAQEQQYVADLASSAPPLGSTQLLQAQLDAAQAQQDGLLQLQVRATHAQPTCLHSRVH